MKKLILAAVLSCVAVAAYSQAKKVEGAKVDAATTESKETKLHGYVVDQMCAKSMMKKSNAIEKAAKHTKECALEEACAASGFGLVYGEGKWVKFDEKGDKLAADMFAQSKKEKDFMADVVGELKGDKLVVASLKESSMSSEEMKGKPVTKPATKEEVKHHDHK